MSPTSQLLALVISRYQERKRGKLAWIATYKCRPSTKGALALNHQALLELRDDASIERTRGDGTAILPLQLAGPL